MSDFIWFRVNKAYVKDIVSLGPSVDVFYIDEKDYEPYVIVYMISYVFNYNSVLLKLEHLYRYCTGSSSYSTEEAFLYFQKTIDQSDVIEAYNIYKRNYSLTKLIG